VAIDRAVLLPTELVVDSAMESPQRDSSGMRSPAMRQESLATEQV
jgi:hypothetical protein